MHELRTTLNDCLEAGGAVLRSYFEAMSDHQIVAKGRDFDLQTIADTQAEQAIIERIRDTHPGHGILSEESGETTRTDAPVRWIVDPLDGTLNFRHGFPYCAVSIAVEVDRALQLAGVYNPFADACYRAERGRGATCNGRPIRVSSIDRLEESLVVAGLPYDRRERIDHYMELFRAFVMKAQGVYRLGSAALDLCQVAAGRLGGYFEEYISLWDWAAGQLIVEEAGGAVTDYHGEDRLEERRQICASNGLLHRQMLAILGPSSIPERGS